MVFASNIERCHPSAGIPSSKSCKILFQIVKKLQPTPFVARTTNRFPDALTDAMRYEETAR